MKLPVERINDSMIHRDDFYPSGLLVSTWVDEALIRRSFQLQRKQNSEAKMKDELLRARGMANVSI